MESRLPFKLTDEFNGEMNAQANLHKKPVLSDAGTPDLHNKVRLRTTLPLGGLPTTEHVQVFFISD